MKKTAKGEYGYISYQKKKRILMTAGLFALPLLIFLTGYIQTGTRKNLFTFVAIMGCLPASKCAVGMIMMLMQKPMKKELYNKIREHVKDMTVIYEATVSAYEKNTPLPCIVICGQNVICYSEDAKIDAGFVEKHIKKILQGNSLKTNVKIFTDLKLYLRRLDEVYAHRKDTIEDVFKPDDRYPGMSREEVIKQVIMAISL